MNIEDLKIAYDKCVDTGSLKKSNYMLFIGASTEMAFMGTFMSS